MPAKKTAKKTVKKGEKKAAKKTAKKAATVEETQKKVVRELSPHARFAFKQDAIGELLGDESTAALEKIYGKVLFRADEGLGRARFWSTGNVALDNALGGGLMRGRIHMLYGPESSAKTHTCFTTIAATQKTCSLTGRHLYYDQVAPKKARQSVCLYVGTEADFYPEWAECAGVDLKNLLVSFADHAEFGLDTVSTFIDQCKVDLVIIDSLACLAPKREVEMSVAAENPGLMARVIGKGVRKILSGLTDAYRRNLEDPSLRVPTFLFTNQMRVDLGVKFGSPETVSGGKAPRYAACTETRFSKARQMPARPGVLGPEWAECKANVKKNKTGRPGRLAEWNIRLQDTESKNAGEVEDEVRLIYLGKQSGVIAREGNKWVVHTVEGRVFPKQEDLMRALEEEPDLKHHTRQAIFSVLHGTPL